MPDGRIREQRLADALTAMARAAMESAGCSGGEPVHVTVLATAEQLAAARAASAAREAAARDAAIPDEVVPDGVESEGVAPEGVAPEGAAAPSAGPVGLAECTGLGPVTRTTLGLLACDATLQAVILSSDGAVLDLGRRVRFASRAQRRALAGRDRGCVVPGCGAPPEICAAHHVGYWQDGGRTDLANLALVCPRHHNEIHLGVWTLVMRSGVPWAVPPAWLDPERCPLRNTVPDAVDAARRLGQQLRLDLDTG